MRIKVLAIAIGVLLLVVVAAVVIPLAVDPNVLKPLISARVREATGRSLHLEGNLHIAVFPWLGVTAQGVELGNNPGFASNLPAGGAKRPFATARRLEVRVKLLPLLEHKLEVGTVVVRGLTLELVRDRQGKANWAGLLPRAGAAQAAGGGLGALVVGGLDVEGATVHWTDLCSGAHITLANLNLQAGAVAASQPVAVQLAFDMSGAAPGRTSGFSGHVRARTEAQLGFASRTYQARALRVEAGIAGSELPGGRLRLRLAGDALYRQAAGVLSLNDLRVHAAGLELHGLHAELALSGQIRADLAADSYRAQPFGLEAKLAGKPLPQGGLTVAARTDLGVDLAGPGAQQKATLAHLQLRAAGLELTGSLTVANPLGSPRAHGALALARFSPRALLERMGWAVPSTADPKALTSAEFNATVSATPEQLRLDPLAVGLDAITVQGSMAVTHFAAPAVRFDLSANRIDANRYLPPAQKGAGTVGAKPGAHEPAPARLVLPMPSWAPLRALDARGELHIGALELGATKMNDVTLEVDSGPEHAGAAAQ